MVVRHGTCFGTLFKLDFVSKPPVWVDEATRHTHDPAIGFFALSFRLVLSCA